ncbi:hypothetical protein PLICRDRAFT_42005 [Plicaturopsis crispa FD-325 SS-3]|nr:hypothetical protein PLICRDRAFT_42005 [Plicaturopsis crispa FD-325 SS-3]
MFYTLPPSQTSCHHSASLSDTAVYPRPRHRTRAVRARVRWTGVACDDCCMGPRADRACAEPLPLHSATASKLMLMRFSAPDLNVGKSPAQ